MRAEGAEDVVGLACVVTAQLFEARQGAGIPEQQTKSAPGGGRGPESKAALHAPRTFPFRPELVHPCCQIHPSAIIPLQGA